MNRAFNPDGIATPASRYSHCVETAGAPRWLHVAGQVGVGPDGEPGAGLDSQIDLCLANIDTALAAAGMSKQALVKLTAYLTSDAPEAIAAFRTRRDAWIGDAPPPASTLVVVKALASPAWLVEIEAVAAAG